MHANMVYSGISSATSSLKGKFRTFIVAGVFALGLTGHAHAAGPGGSYIQGAYADWDDADDGYNIGGSLAITPSVRLFADYTDTDLEQLRIGAGAVFPVSNLVNLEVGGSYQNLDAGGFGPGPGGLDDDGIGIHGIGRFFVTPELTLAGKVEYVFRDDLEDEAVLGFDVDYRVLPALSAFLSYDIYDEIDNDLLMVGARLHF
jgi:hypothetical protein